MGDGSRFTSGRDRDRHQACEGIMSWKSKLAQVVVAILTLLALLIGSGALGAATDQCAVVRPRSKPGESVPPSVCRMARGNHVCSGTVLASARGTSLVVCCNHCFADLPWPGGKIPRGKYPAECTITRLSDGKQFRGVAVDGDPTVDSALIVVRELETDKPPGVGRANVGDSCEHWGISSGHTTGRFVKYDNDGDSYPDMREASTCRSIPGDSGAGVFSGGKLVAVNWGYDGKGLQRGTPVVYHLRFARSSRTLSASYPDLWRGIPADPAVPGVPAPPTITVPPRVRPQCPDGNCPLPSPWSRPRLLPWRR